MARLPGKVAGAVMAYVDGRLAADPYRMSKPLAGELTGTRGARNGDYRMLLRIDDQPPTVWIAHVDHRAHMYRPR
jgi:mRNA-degrading endonuclease RelE of RelBE toxin-antitoxin system